MRTRNLVILILVVAAAAAYFYFVERHQPTTDEVRQQADQVFPGVDSDDIDVIEIAGPKSTVRLEKRGDDWHLTEPIEFPADTSKVSSVLRSLLNLKTNRTLAAGEVDPAAHGLDEPFLTVELSTSDGEPLRLLVGNETPLGASRAVSRDGAEVVLCAGWFTNELDREIDDWRSSEVVEIFADQVVSIDVEAGTDRIKAVRADEQWRLLQPVDDLADPDHLRNLISDINALQVKDFLDDGPDPAQLGLEPPGCHVTLVRSAGDQPVSLEFGATRDVDGATQVACRRNGDTLFWVSDNAQTRLAKAPVRWRAAKVYPFDIWDAQGLTLTAGESGVELERRERVWRIAGGDEADATEVQDRLRSLSELEAVDFDLLEPSTPEMGRVELLLGDQYGDEEEATDSVTLVFHRPMAAAGNAAVTVSSRNTVMGVTATAVEEILGDLESLRPVAPAAVAEVEPGNDTAPGEE